MEYQDPTDIGDVLLGIDELPSSSAAVVPEKHLDSPILVSILERLLSIHERALHRAVGVKPTQYDPHRARVVDTYLRKNPIEAYSSIRKPMLQFCDALDYCVNMPEILTAERYPYLFSLTADSTFRLQTDLRLARRIFEHELTAYCSQVAELMKPTQLSALKESIRVPNVLTPRAILSANRLSLWSEVVDRYRSEYRSSYRRRKHTLGPIRYVCCDGFLLIKTDVLRRWQLMTFEQAQMIQDCCAARHNVELALCFNFHNGTERLASHVTEILAWQEEVLLTYGNEGYELVKSPEAVFKAKLNALTDGDILGYSSLDRTLDKMMEKERKLNGATFLIRKLARLVDRVSSIYDAAELFGLTKLSGHPSVYAERSLLSVKKEALPKGTISPFAVRQMERMFKHIVLSGYIKENSSWPRFVCPPALDTTLRRHYLNQVTTLPLGSYPISDLDAIVFAKFVEYDYSEDYLKFLDDKAICPGATEMSKFWFGGHRNETRRLLQKILEVEHFDTRALVERLRKGGFTDEERVVELTQKERELKVAARCFCKLTMAVRTFFTSTEYNLKEQFMKKYMPQQTMTMSSTETKSRLYNLVRTAKSRDRVLLEVDFSRWNLRWREETVNGIAGVLEDIFGLPGVFSQAHPFFESATIVMTDKHSLPAFADPSIPITRWPESALVYRGKHLGGFEGIQQALWTICTVSMMYWVLHDQNVSFLMAGQGDNQIFALTFASSDQSLDKKLRRLLAIMEVRCSLLNHEVKPDECIDSTTVLTYSKDIYVEGNHILYCLKFASRTFKREEIDIPSLSTEIAAISACSMACADSVYNTPKAIFWKTYQTLRFLSERLNAPVHVAEKPELSRLLANPDMLEFVLLVPGSLGGLPIMQWSRFFMKGEVDDLTWDVAAVRSLAATLPRLQKDLNACIDGRYTSPKPKLEQLLLDPHSIPLDRPKDLKRLVKDAVAARLPDITRNVWIKNIFSENSAIAGKALLRALASTRPLYPQIMSDVYALSPSGVRDALLSRFTMTRTINSVTKRPSFSADIIAANARLLEFMRKRFEATKGRFSTQPRFGSTYETCAALRRLWGPEVEHRQIGVYNPFDFPLRFDDNKSPMITCSVRTGHDRPHSSVGRYQPNFGTKTRQKVSDHGFKIITSSSTVQDLKSLIMTASELGGDPSLMQMLSEITLARSPWTVSQLSGVLPTSFAGAAAHRHDAINASAFSVLGSRTVPTHLNFCSDRAGKLSGGEFDYPIAFQEFYLVLTNIVQVLTYGGFLDSNASIGFMMSDSYEVLPDEPVKCEKPEILTWGVQPTNKLIYASELMTRELPTVPSPSIVPHSSNENLATDILVYNYIMAKMINRRKLLVGSSLVNQPVDLLDMKEFNHARPGDVVRAISWVIQALSVSTAVLSDSSAAHTTLSELMLTTSRQFAPLLTRHLVHPQHHSSEFALAYDAVLEPGISGGRPAADNLAGHLYEQAVLSLRAREALLREVPVVLTSDYKSYGVSFALAHSIWMLSMQTRNMDKLLVTGYQRLMLMSAMHATFANARELQILLALRGTLESMTQPSFLHRKGLPAASLKLMYCPTTTSEFVRELRRRTAVPTVSRHALFYDGFPMFDGRNRCVFERFEYEGVLRPLCDCPDTSAEERMKDRFLSQLTRGVGTYATALSIWLTILQNERRSLARRDVIAIGVGHGATGVAALNAGCSQIIGVDLRESFPGVIQREASYKPPEILVHGYADRFRWSQIVSSVGGDATRIGDSPIPLESAAVIIVDIEQHLDVVLNVLSQLPPCETLIVRVTCCTRWAEYVADLITASRIYNTSALRSTHKQSYVLIGSGRRAVGASANYERVRITQQPRFNCTSPYSNKYVTSYFNRVLRRVGVGFKEITTAHVEEAITSLRRRSTNANDSVIAAELAAASQDLVDCLRLFRSSDALTWHDISACSSQARSLLARWLTIDRRTADALRTTLLM